MERATRLIIDIGILPRSLTARSLVVAATLDDQLRYERKMGETVMLVARLAEGFQRECVAGARFIGFSSDESGLPQAHVTEIKWFQTPTACPSASDGGVFARIDQPVFDQLLAGTSTPSGFEEAETPALSQDLYAIIARQVAERQDNICCFRGTRLQGNEAGATPIRPPDSGGTVHLRNFLYLENDVAKLFNIFAWTVGPEYEIIIDALRVPATVLTAINSNGHLILTADPDWWPDAEALAWHRKQFFDQLENRI